MFRAMPLVAFALAGLVLAATVAASCWLAVEPPTGATAIALRDSPPPPSAKGVYPVVGVMVLGTAVAGAFALVGVILAVKPARTPGRRSR